MIQLLTIGILGIFLFVCQRKLYERWWLKYLRVSISFGSDHIFQGEQGELKEIIENRKWLPLAMLKVKFKTDRRLIFAQDKGSQTTDQYYRNDVFRVGGGERVTRTLKFTGGMRGYYTIDEVSLVASDLFLQGQMVGEQKNETALYVYPRPYESGRFLQSLMRINGEMLSRRHLMEDPFEYRGIREYQPYDDMRRINWKATAKTGDLKVNEQNYTSLKSVRVFFNIEDSSILKKEDGVELSLRVAASLCAFFLGQGMRVSCCGNGLDIVTRQPVFIEERAGQRHLDEVYRALARVDTRQPAADFGAVFRRQIFQKDAGAFTCFVSPNQYDDFVELLVSYKESGKPFQWFYPAAEYEKPKFAPALADCVTVVRGEL